MMHSILLMLCLTLSPALLSQEIYIYSMPGNYISPVEGVSWEIKEVYISAGMYQILVNKDVFPNELSAVDTLYMPSWIAEQELLDEGMDLTYLFIINEKRTLE
jgi:hypothetical protein